MGVRGMGKGGKCFLVGGGGGGTLVLWERARGAAVPRANGISLVHWISLCCDALLFCRDGWSNGS